MLLAFKFGNYELSMTLSDLEDMMPVEREFYLKLYTKKINEEVKRKEEEIEKIKRGR
jgi:hypothetical protein